MELETWLKDFYPRIVEDLGINVEMDRLSAKIMHELGKGKLLRDDVLRRVIENKRVAIVGGAVEEKDAVDLNGFDVLITAGKSVLKIPNVIPNVHVTDMEEGLEVLLKLEREGCILVLHAHGDNVDRIKEIVPMLKGFVATTQVEPFDGIYNFCGFTDGDRAVSIAVKMGAKEIRLVGFDFKKAEGIKLKKLRWAKRIIETILRDRDENRDNLS